MGFLKKYPAISFGVVITLIFLAFAALQVTFIDTIELKLYDARMAMRGQAEESESIVLVEIDNDSIDKLGRWPWPRSRIAEGIKTVSDAGARLIGLNIIYSEPDESTALKELQYLSEMLAKSIGQQPNGQQVLEAMEQARDRLDNDRILASALAEAGNVVLPVFFKDALVAEETRTKSQTLAPEAVGDVSNPRDLAVPVGGRISMPIPEFFEAAGGVGHVNLSYDPDGVVRRETLLYRYGGLHIPSFTLKLAALYLNVPAGKIQATLGDEVTAGPLSIPVTQRTDMLITFKKAEESSAFKRASFVEVINGNIPGAFFKDKIVMITPTAAGIMNPISTPAGGVMSVGQLSAHTIWTMLNRQFIRQPVLEPDRRFRPDPSGGGNRDGPDAPAQGPLFRGFVRRHPGRDAGGVLLSFRVGGALDRGDLSAPAAHHRLHRGDDAQLLRHRGPEGEGRGAIGGDQPDAGDFLSEPGDARHGL